MFEKKDIIFSETLGVCQVAELPKLSSKAGEQIPYYGLKSIYDKSKVSYIPVEHHQVQLRELISYEEAKKLLDNPPENLDKLLLQEAEYVVANHKK
ncbi:MAG: CarD family transcriptional regulator [Clostridiales bacterium]|nr:CarD family transcriptional regulator [Clostridiales bacterium]